MIDLILESKQLPELIFEYTALQCSDFGVGRERIHYICVL